MFPVFCLHENLKDIPLTLHQNFVHFFTTNYLEIHIFGKILHILLKIYYYFYLSIWVLYLQVCLYTMWVPGFCGSQKRVLTIFHIVHCRGLWLSQLGRTIDCFSPSKVSIILSGTIEGRPYRKEALRLVLSQIFLVFLCIQKLGLMFSLWANQRQQQYSIPLWELLQLSLSTSPEEVFHVWYWLFC